MINSRYEIIKKLGEGRSAVYLCNDIEYPNKKFAIKILSPKVDEIERANFLKEFFTLQRLEHPNIIKAYEYGTVYKYDGEEEIKIGSAYIILEFFEGEELLSLKTIHQESVLKEIIKQICAVLYYLHQSKYIYYDLKPENILVSIINDKPQIRLIDLGLAEYSPSPSDYEIKGTAYYIAPELLKKETHNHSVDFYSLGIILYQIIYNQFPFTSKNELEIYKAAIEDEFSFPQFDDFSNELIAITRKLLEKDVSQRYNSALTIIEDLGIQLDLETTKEFLPANTYSCRDSVIERLSSYINDSESTEVYSIRGFEGVGKSSLLNKIQEKYTQAVKVSEVKGKTAEEIFRHLLRQILFSESVFQSLSEKDKNYLYETVALHQTNNIIYDFRNCIAIISSNSKFILLLDDFNMYDQLVSNLLLDIIPILQVNNIKVILSESSHHEFISPKLSNLKEITLGAFVKKELKIFLEESFYSDFPQESLQSLIVKNADLIPGNIKLFINDLIQFGIMKFSSDGITFHDGEEKFTSIIEAHYAVYDLRLANLNESDLAAAQIISAFEIYIDMEILSVLLGLEKSEVDEIISNLQFNNIIQKFVSDESLIFTSEALKNYIYASIENKKEFHQNIVTNINQKISAFKRVEIARQYELAGDFENCFRVTLEEVNESERHSGYSYIKNLLSHLIELPLRKELLESAKVKLSEVCLKLGDVQSSLALIKDLKSELSPSKIDARLFTIEGSALIASGEYEAGRRVISELLKAIKDEDEKNRLKVELAYADFELKRYNEAVELCEKILQNDNLPSELKGRCYNLKGMINIYQNNNLKSALQNFENAKTHFVNVKQPGRISGVEVNIGNVYNIVGEFEKAEEHWQYASQINQSIGNLEHEGMLRQSLGVFYFNRAKYDLAIESYNKSKKIFESLGIDIQIGQNLWNLAEVYLTICNYNDSLKLLEDSKNYFERNNSYKELADVLFLLCKLYYKIGADRELEATIEKYKGSMNLASESIIELQEKILNQFLSYRKSRIKLIDELNKIAHDFYVLKEFNNYAETIFLSVKVLFENKKYKEAVAQLNSSSLIDLCSQNSILEAEREYFLGKISKNSNSEKLSSPLTYFEKAYDLIKDEYISELTWKVLFEISDLYIERGNLSKAKYFVTYTRELIYYIAEKIESPQLRAAYLRSRERLITLKKLESFYPSN